MKFLWLNINPLLKLSFCHCEEPNAVSATRQSTLIKDGLLLRRRFAPLIAMTIKCVVLGIMLLFLPLTSHALVFEEKLANLAQEQYAQGIFKEIRCIVCTGESIADSRADLARNLRAAVREKIKDGYTETQILEYVKTRYGDDILMKPPLMSATYLLWFGPIIILLSGFIIMLAMLRRSKYKKI